MQQGNGPGELRFVLPLPSSTVIQIGFLVCPAFHHFQRNVDIALQEVNSFLASSSPNASILNTLSGPAIPMRRGTFFVFCCQKRQQDSRLPGIRFFSCRQESRSCPHFATVSLSCLYVLCCLHRRLGLLMSRHQLVLSRPRTVHRRRTSWSGRLPPRSFGATPPHCGRWPARPTPWIRRAHFP